MPAATVDRTAEKCLLQKCHRARNPAQYRHQYQMWQLAGEPICDRCRPEPSPQKSKWTIDSYRLAVDTYRNAESKEQKREMERLIADIKSDFRSEITQ
jgi:hypothetical protein